MKNIRIILLVTVVISLLSFKAVAQDSLSTGDNGLKPKFQLRLGLTQYTRPYSNFGLELEYERFISPHWSVALNVFGNLKTNDDYRIRSGYQAANKFKFNDYQDGLVGGIAFNYYLNKGSRSGHYFSVSANYLFGFYTRRKYEIDLQAATVVENEKRLFGSNPVVGINYGYRKTFNSGLFVEGRVGVRYEDSISNILRPFQSLKFEAQLTVGWVIPFKKKR